MENLSAEPANPSQHLLVAFLAQRPFKSVPELHTKLQSIGQARSRGLALIGQPTQTGCLCIGCYLYGEAAFQLKPAKVCPSLEGKHSDQMAKMKRCPSPAPNLGLGTHNDVINRNTGTSLSHPRSPPNPK